MSASPRSRTTWAKRIRLIVTASVGGASMPADAATLTELLRIADRALYTAKSMGRNRVQIGAHGDEGSIEGLMERGSVLNFVQGLVDYVDASYGAVDHASEAAHLAGLVADELGLESGQRWRACAAARLHDIGKLAVPKEILAKPGALSHEEWKLLRRHPDVGAEMLSLAPGLRDVAEVVRQHHERHDGAGYPEELKRQRNLCRGPGRGGVRHVGRDALRSAPPIRAHSGRGHDRAAPGGGQPARPADCRCLPRRALPERGLRASRLTRQLAEREN